MILTKKMLFVKPWFLFAILAILITSIGVFSSGRIVPIQSQVADIQCPLLKENADKVNTSKLDELKLRMNLCRHESHKL